MISARPVEGRFRTLRWAANAVLVAILVAIPWIRIAGEPLVLLDVPARRFHVFGLVIFPQELYFLWLILAALALALFFFTALAGRLWCGWACPQTVFTDIFAGLGRWIEGWSGGFRRPQRVAAWRLVAKHAVWALLCAVIAFHLVGYFRSPYALLAAAREGAFGGAAFAFFGVITALLFADLVFVRQTFCKFLCPYARFQGVMFDHDTLVVGYDTARGEPRGKRTSAASGDCVDCGLCVQVCPTGIDIREGLQLECIACTQCIDACNGVMAKVGREPELIGYRSLVSLEGLRPARLLRPRVVAYAALLVAVGVAFGALLVERKPLDLQVIRNRANLFATAADGRRGNAFTLHVQNRSREEARYRVALEPSADFDLVAGLNPVTVGAIESAELRVFVLARDDLEGAEDRELRFVLEEVDEPSQRVVRSARFLTTQTGAAPAVPSSSNAGSRMAPLGG